MTPAGQVTVGVTGDANGITVSLPVRRQLPPGFDPRSLPRGPFGLIGSDGRVLTRLRQPEDRSRTAVHFPMQELARLGGAALSCLRIVDQGNATWRVLSVRATGGESTGFAFPAAAEAVALRDRTLGMQKDLSNHIAQRSQFLTQLSSARSLLAQENIFDGSRCLTPRVQALPPRPDDACSEDERLAVAGAACGRSAAIAWPACGIFSGYSAKHGPLPGEEELQAGCKSQERWASRVRALAPTATRALATGGTEGCTDVHEGSCRLIKRLIESKEKELMLNRLPSCLEKVGTRCREAEEMWIKTTNDVRAQPKIQVAQCEEAIATLANSEATRQQLEKTIADTEASLALSQARMRNGVVPRADLSELPCR